jgi:replicative DNA helicase
MVEPLSGFQDELGALKARLQLHYKNPGKILGLETGLADLDFLTGGLEKAELTVVAARPSVGKTALAINIANHVLQQLQEKEVIVILTQEMSKRQLHWRWASMLSGISSTAIKRGQYYYNGLLVATEKEKYIAFAAGLKQVAELPVIVQQGGITTEYMQALLERVAQGYKIKLVVDDYLGLHTDIHRGRQRE